MSRSLTRPASLALVVTLFVCLLFLLPTVQLPLNIIPQPSIPLPDSRTDRPMQALYQDEADAAREGWTSDRLRLAGDLWREAGDLPRAVAYWEAAEPDAALLRDRAQAYLDLGRWADASDALSRLLALLPDDSTERTWADFQLGLIRSAADPAQASDLLRAAQSTYVDQVPPLLAALASGDPTRIGVALADQKLWAYAELAFSQAAGDPVALAYGGWVRDMQGKDGARWIDAAAALAPDNAQVRLLQGLHLRLNYQYQDSLSAIIQAVALDSENPALYAELGKAYQLTGDLTSAQHWLQFAAAMDSQFQPMLEAFYQDERDALIGLGLIDKSTVLPESTPSP